MSHTSLCGPPGLLALCLILLTACASVDIGGPHASKRNPQAGILQLADGKQIAVLPETLNYTGEGVYTWPNGRQQSGTWVNGQLEGMGTETTQTERYSGQWLDGQRHGHVELETTDGTRYVGDFKDGLAHGKGTQTANAGVYQGTWQNGMRQGQGQFNSASGAVYQGYWDNNLRAGYGREQFANGGVYEGDWQDDKPDGFGEFLFPTGAFYEGSWVAGRRQGYGSWHSPANLSYEGTWREDKRDGFGKELRPDGSSFAGHWRADQRHGKGKEILADGSSHEGLWQADEIAGPGSRTNRLGIVITGDWAGDQITSGKLQLPSGLTYQGDLFNDTGQQVAPSLVRWMTSQASTGDAVAQYFLASIYSDFAEPKPQPQTAQVWLQRAADAAVSEAQFRLSMLLQNSDVAAAIQWLKLAAAQDHPRANEILGEYLHTGTYLAQDLQAAMAHYERAANSGSVAATNNLAWLLATTADTKNANPQRAIELIRPFVLYLGNWQHLDTLAAAHARLGEMETARNMQNQALIQARSIAAESTVDEMADRLALYTQGQPYIE